MRNHTFETEEFVLSDALKIYKRKMRFPLSSSPATPG